MSDLLSDARALKNRQQAIADRISAVKAKYTDAIRSINASLDTIEASGGDVARALSPAVVESALRPRVESLLAQIEKLTVTASAVSLNTATIATSAQEAASVSERIAAVAQQLPDHVVDVIDADVIQPAIDTLNETWEELEESWDEAAQVFNDETAEWKQEMERVRDAFATTLAELNVESITQRWQGAASVLTAKASEDLASVQHRATELHRKVVALIATLESIVEAFGRTQRIAQEATSSAATGLELVTDILHDVKSALAAVS